MLVSTHHAVADENQCSKFHILLKGVNDCADYLLTDEANTWYWKSA